MRRIGSFFARQRIGMLEAFAALMRTSRARVTEASWRPRKRLSRSPNGRLSIVAISRHSA